MSQPAFYSGYRLVHPILDANSPLGERNHFRITAIRNIKIKPLSKRQPKLTGDEPIQDLLSTAAKS